MVNLTSCPIGTHKSASNLIGLLEKWICNQHSLDLVARISYFWPNLIVLQILWNQRGTFVTFLKTPIYVTFSSFVTDGLLLYSCLLMNPQLTQLPINPILLNIVQESNEHWETLRLRKTQMNIGKHWNLQKSFFNQFYVHNGARMDSTPLYLKIVWIQSSLFSSSLCLVTIR